MRAEISYLNIFVAYNRTAIHTTNGNIAEYFVACAALIEMIISANYPSAVF